MLRRILLVRPMFTLLSLQYNVAISSGTAGSSSDGAENTAAIVGGLALIAAASSILLQVGKDAPAKPKAVGTTEDRLLATTSTSSSLQKLFRLLPPILTEAPPVARQETSLPEITASEAQPEETSSVPATLKRLLISLVIQYMLCKDEMRLISA
ncbi:hypothetical protein HID58_078256 [Brassica napus]|uniref:Uncharacterized protein n=1 Tax=Brassica napus TaxID=3708 RepID=A0ABQ7YSP1_BRANA|nr:hypothetical protein HID58_078256 [Brassica napus]